MRRCTSEYAEKLSGEGWVEVENSPKGIIMANPDETCLHEMRSGKCLMDKDHRGRHSTIVFYCEGCGKVMRGTPHLIQQVKLGDGSIDDEFGFCFMCFKKDEREYMRC